MYSVSKKLSEDEILLTARGGGHYLAVARNIKEFLLG